MNNIFGGNLPGISSVLMPGNLVSRAKSLKVNNNYY